MIREKAIWYGIKNRCYNKESRYYYRYGGRGIVMQDSWIESFDNFINDMGLRPTNKHSIDRIDNNGNYTKDNCVWATPQEQLENRDVSHKDIKDKCTRVITLRAYVSDIDEISKIASNRNTSLSSIIKEAIKCYIDLYNDRF